MSAGELAVLAGRAVEAALAAGAGDAEAYVEDSVGREIRIFAGEVESLSAAAQRGVGVRAWIGGRAGYGYGTDLSPAGIGAIAAAAVGGAEVADPDEHAAVPRANGAAVPEIAGLHDPELAATPTEQKIELAKEVERACRAADERVIQVEDTVYADEQGRAAIASSSGLEGSFEATTCYAYAYAIAADEDDRETGLGFGLGRSPGHLDPEAIGREAAERGVSLLGASKPASRSCPVVLDQTVAASFVGFIGSTLCADSVQRGRSPFAGKLGEQIGSGALSVFDDGLDPGGLASAPVDGEGTPRRRTTLIESGRLATYLHDSYTARREGGEARSTGNASRGGYRSAPSVSTSNLIVATGEPDFEGLLREASDGVYVTDVSGLHSGVNPVSGQFSVGATGRLISGGELAAPANEFTIASDLVSMLKAVRATASEARWVPFGGSVNTPAILIAEMAVGGA
jgi:PmbA protein